MADFDLQAHDCHVAFHFSLSFLLPHEIGILLALSVLRLRRSTVRYKCTHLTVLLGGISTSRLGMRDHARVRL